MDLILIFQKLFDVTLSDRTSYKMERNRFCHLCSARTHTNQLSFPLHPNCNILLWTKLNSSHKVTKLVRRSVSMLVNAAFSELLLHIQFIYVSSASFTLRDIIRWQSHWSALTYAPLIATSATSSRMFSSSNNKIALVLLTTYFQFK